MDKTSLMYSSDYFWAALTWVQVDEPVTSDEEGVSEPARSNSKHLIEVKALNGQS